METGRIWTAQSDSSRPLPLDARKPASLCTQVIEVSAPLDAQLGIFPKKTVPDSLYQAIFGQPDLTVLQPLLTYAVLDAAKIPNLPELLAASQLPHRCLLQGQAFENLANVAPWLVTAGRAQRIHKTAFHRR